MKAAKQQGEEITLTRSHDGGVAQPEAWTILASQMKIELPVLLGNHGGHLEGPRKPPDPP